MNKNILSAIFILCTSAAATAQVAFPGAEGAGRFATGGRGTAASPTTIYQVTTLLDDNSTGSLRYAVTNATGTHRTIIFKVSGTIRLNSPLDITRSNMTIAGQTAPGDGICIADYPVTIKANNVIVRYLRFRMGDKAGAAASDYDALNARGRKHIIIDHCTVSWGVDETLTFYENDSSTIQYTMISEPLNQSYHNEGAGNEAHGFGGIWGGKLVSFHHNLFAHCLGRTPRFDGIRNIPDENADFRNNVIYNWGDYTVNGGEGGKYNVVNNYYKHGPSTPANRQTRLLNPFKQTTPFIDYGKFFMTGNYVDASVAVTNNNWSGAVMSGGTAADTVRAKALTPFAIVPITSFTALEAYQQVLTGVGATLPKRDTLDQRIIRNVIDRTGSIINVQGGYPAYTPYATSSQTAWPTLLSATAPTDTDGDGMHDSWETRRGLNPSAAADRQTISSNGFTNLENYLNGDSIVAAGVLNTCVQAKPITATNSGTWINAKDTTYSNVMATDSMNVVASIFANGNYGQFNVSYYVTNTIRRDANNKPYLNRNVTINALNGAAITSPVTVRIYITQAEFQALQAADNTITSVADLRIVKVPSNSCLTTMTGTPVVITPTSVVNFGTYGNGFFLEFTTSSFSTFFIMSASAAPVPLDLISYTATLSNGAVKNVWRVENQINVDKYQVERSSNGQIFQQIGFVQAVNVTTSYEYSYIDAAPLKGTSFYRLKMIDIDGKFKYSPVVTINNQQKASLIVAPNPVVSSLNISHPASAATSSIWIFSADGRKVMEARVLPNVSQTTLNVSSIESGVYEVIFITGDQKTSTRFIKQ
jgi:hypothetical protein